MFLKLVNLNFEASQICKKKTRDLNQNKLRNEEYEDTTQQESRTTAGRNRLKTRAATLEADSTSRTVIGNYNS